ncbi:MAG: transposase, partial [Mesorhizobium sp.]
MRQPQRPFVVEIKQKRELVKRPQSIWGGIDLAAIANELSEAKKEG